VKSGSAKRPTERESIIDEAEYKERGPAETLFIEKDAQTRRPN
jgi:hypothetical protein